MLATVSPDADAAYGGGGSLHVEELDAGGFDFVTSDAVSSGFDFDFDFVSSDASSSYVRTSRNVPLLMPWHIMGLCPTANLQCPVCSAPFFSL
jgi:hypothetical protein